MDRNKHLPQQEIEVATTCSTCLYCNVTDLCDYLDEDNNGYCYKKQQNINQTDLICEEYIEDYTN